MHRVIFALVLGLFVSGCGCGDDVTLEIIEPTDGRTLNAGDDVDEDAEGVQIIVLVATEGLDLGARVDLTVNSEVVPGEVVGGGTARFDAVTLTPGQNTLRASAEGESSATITVTLGDGDQCPAVTISRPTDGATLRGTDDEDGEACGEFVYTVVASTSAQEGRGASLYVNGNSVGETEVSGAELRFAGITLDSGGNDLEVRLDGDGDCSAAASVTVDCGVTCTILSPTGDTLNGEDDESDDPGMQVDVEVETDAEDGEEITIVVDDDEESSVEASGGSAEFDDVPLAEGERTIQAICRDSAGNESRSARVRFLVDSIAPDVEITTERTDYNLEDGDFDRDTPGIQIQLCGTSSEDAELCAAVEGADPGADGCVQVDADEEGCGVVTCSGQVSLELSATDEAENVGSATLTVNCDDGLPQLQIIDPDDGELLNSTRDTVPGGGLNYDVVVCVSEVGRDVQLYRSGSELGAPVASVGQDCDSPAYGLLPGTATFEALSIPEGDTTLRADVRDTSNNLGVSPEITFNVDTVPPRLDIAVCGDVLGPQDDEDGVSNNGVQYSFRGTTDQASVTLTVTAEDGSSQQYTDDADQFGALDYDEITFEQGVSTITATLTDVAGNVAQLECTVTANAGGFVTIASPAAGTDFTAATDGNGAVVGYQGAVVRVVSDGPVGGMDVCVDAFDGVATVTECVLYDDAAGVDVTIALPEGTNAARDVTLTARTDDGHPAGPLSSAAVVVQVDTLAPATPGALTLRLVDRRAGIVEIDFTAVEDPTGRNVARYEVRDSLTPFGSENDGSIVTNVAVGGVQAPGAAQTLSVPDLRTQTLHYLAVRAVDALGNVGLSSSAFVNVALLVDVIDSPDLVASTRFGMSVSGGFDVNGDLYDDFVVGTNDIVFGDMTAYLYYGGPDGPTLATTFDGGAVFESFGFSVALLRDFNGDGFADIAISNYYAGAAINGAVYIYFGADDLAPVLAPGDADVILNGEAGDYFGWRVASAGDVNADGRSDLLVGATPYSTFGDGRAYVVLGHDTPGIYDMPADRDLVIDGVIADGGMGGALGAAGDLNGDGFDDYVIGACRNDNEGAAYVFLGESDLSIAADRDRDASDADEILSAAAGELGFGCSVGGVGDADGDGELDIVVGVSNRDPSNRGAFRFYPGDGLGGFGSSLEFRNDGGVSSNDDRVGFALAVTTGTEGTDQPSLDEANAVADVIVGSYRWADGPGRTLIYWGGPGLAAGDVASVPAFVDQPAGSSSLSALSWAGDVDGDGYPDLIMGDESAAVGGIAAAGRVYLVH